RFRLGFLSGGRRTDLRFAHAIVGNSRHAFRIHAHCNAFDKSTFSARETKTFADVTSVRALATNVIATEENRLKQFELGFVKVPAPVPVPILVPIPGWFDLGLPSSCRAKVISNS
ncbi:hypothetical protein PFISCL1PPCAC_16948, partial [Pristionchus fissidentatus]